MLYCTQNPHPHKQTQNPHTSTHTLYIKSGDQKVSFHSHCNLLECHFWWPSATGRGSVRASLSSKSHWQMRKVGRVRGTTCVYSTEIQTRRHEDTDTQRHNTNTDTDTQCTRYNCAQQTDGWSWVVQWRAICQVGSGETHSSSTLVVTQVGLKQELRFSHVEEPKVPSTKKCQEVPRSASNGCKRLGWVTGRCCGTSTSCLPWLIAAGAPPSSASTHQWPKIELWLLPFSW